MPKSSRERTLSADPRVFRFRIRCRRCDASFVTLQTARQHFVVECPSVGDTAIQCGCCDKRYTSWPLCVAHLNQRGAHLRPPLDTVTVSSSSDKGGNSSPVKVSPSVSPPDSPVARPSGVPVSTTAVAASASSTSVSPLLTSSDCDLISQALGPSDLARQLQVGTSYTTDSVWRRRFYVVARHLFIWVRETANPQPNSGSVLGSGELLRNCPFEFDATAPLQQMASEVLPFYQMIANEDYDPAL